MLGLSAYFNKVSVKLKEWLTSKRFSIYLICVFIASLIWLLIKSSHEYNNQFPISIELVNPPAGNWMILDNTSEIIVEVYGFGFDLISYHLFGLDKLQIDLSSFEVNDAVDPAYIIIPEAYISNEANRLFKGKQQVLNIYPANLKVDLSKAITKKVPVKLNVKVYPAPGFKIKGIPQLTPNNIEFFGPSSLLLPLEYVNTEIDTIRDIRLLNRKKINLQLDSLEQYIVGKTDEYLTVEVDELTSGSIEIKVKPSINKAGLEVKVLPSKVKVYYQVGLSDYQKISENLFTAEIKFPDSDVYPEKLKVVLSQLPDFVEVNRIEPLFVEYLIIKN